ncbi:MAG: ABC transporter ATP-binding protein [Spirochaetia bacterium]
MNARTERLKRIISRLHEDVENYEGSVSRDLGRLWRDYLSPYKVRIIIALTATIFWSAHPFLVSLLSRYLVDKVLLVGQSADLSAIPGQWAKHQNYVILLFSIWAAFVSTHWLSLWLILNIGQQLIYRFRKNLHEKLQVLHVGFFDSMETGRIMSRVMDDVQVIKLWSTNQVLNIAAYLYRMVIGLGILFYLNWLLTLIILISLPLYAWAIAAMRPVIKNTNIALRKLNSTMYALSSERINGINVVKAFGQEKQELGRFTHKIYNNIRLGMRMISYQAFMGLLAGIISAATTGIILYIGVTQVRTGAMTVGTVVAYITALPQLFAQINMLTVIATTIQAVLVVIQRVFRFLDEPEEVAPGNIKLDGMRGKIEFDDVTFSYPGQDKPSLEEVSFTIPPGTKTAIMGPSGAGKTTVFQLILRFYDPQSGHVRLGGVDLVDADVKSIHKHAVMVQQEPVIFSGTLAQNIAYGNLDARPVEIMEAAQQAELHDFIMSLPVKYETEVGQNGISLSGGQKQRLALATALLTKPEVLLLDDTTSALDAETESRIRSTLNKVLKDRTSLIITQRIATAKDCDIILIFENGRITQRGTHSELKEQKGFYRKIFLQQKSI